MKQRIKLGYKDGTDEEAYIVPSHLIVTGVSQLSGKTTALEALINRSGLKAVIFKTKIGERSFTDGQEVPPFFRDRSDYEFVKSLIEAYSKEKLFLEKGTLMRLCKGSVSLIDIKTRVDNELAEGKLRGLKEEIHTRLQHYLENLIPQIQYANLSKTLMVYEGVNIMNLERFSEEAQSLIIQSVADEILKTMNGIILVIPEAWKFISQKYNNPCKRVVESFIRQGAANQNYIWIDSQDMAGVDKTPLKQISTWILGFQSERNEVKHTLDQIALPKKSKPKEEDIMNLKRGHFIVSDYEGVTKVYVQPSWMKNDMAIKISKGELSVDVIDSPNNLVPLSMPMQQEMRDKAEARIEDGKLQKQMTELRIDFFNKIQEIQLIINKSFEEIYSLKSSKKEVNVDEIVSLVLQKMPMNKPIDNSIIDEEEIIRKVIARVPNPSGSVTYEVAPLEKIKKDFLIEAKQKLLASINGLEDKQKKMLRWIEQNQKNTLKKEVFLNCFGQSCTGGSAYTELSKKILEMKNLEIIRVDTQQRIFPYLKGRITSLVSQYGATEQEIQSVYDHILMEILK
jgi:hypothetical protein